MQDFQQRYDINMSYTVLYCLATSFGAVYIVIGNSWVSVPTDEHADEAEGGGSLHRPPEL